MNRSDVKARWWAGPDPKDQEAIEITALHSRMAISLHDSQNVSERTRTSPGHGCYCVSQGIGLRDGDPWGVYERKPSGALRRIQSTQTPITPSREQAERNLLRWLWIKRTTPSQRRKEPLEAWLRRNLECVRAQVENVDVERFLEKNPERI